MTEEEAACQDPELAVLSAMAHGKDADVDRTLRIATAAMAASVGLDPDRSTLYFDLVMTSLSAAAKEALQSMDPAKYEYQSEFARWYFAQGRVEGRAEGEAEGEARGRMEGKAEGKAELVLKLITLRFGVLPADVQQQVRRASASELDGMAERVLTARSLDEAVIRR